MATPNRPTISVSAGLYQRLKDHCLAADQPISWTAQRIINEALDAIGKRPPRSTITEGEDYEIRGVRMKRAHDNFGARVWIATVRLEGGREGWIVYHRTDRNERYPVNLEHEDSFAAALRTARAFVAAYEAVDAAPAEAS